MADLKIPYEWHAALVSKDLKCLQKAQQRFTVSAPSLEVVNELVPFIRRYKTLDCYDTHGGLAFDGSLINDTKLWCPKLHYKKFILEMIARKTKTNYNRILLLDVELRYKQSFFK